MATTRITLAVMSVYLWGALPAFAQDGGTVNVVPMPDSTILARQQSELNYRPAWHAMLTDVPGDWVRVGTTIVQPRSLPYIAGIGVLTAGLVTVDPASYTKSHTIYNNNATVRSASDVIIHVGDGKTAFGMAGAFALYGFIANDSRAIRTASQIGEVVIASGIVVQLLKRVSGRESPERCTGFHSRWRMFPNWRSYNKNQPKYYSFPSGHTTTIMGVVTVIAENYPEVTWLRPLGYSVVGLVGLSLVNVGWHWYSDLPLAMGLGYAFGKIVAHPFQSSDDGAHNANGPQVSVTPMIFQQGTGVMLAVTL